MISTDGRTVRKRGCPLEPDRADPAKPGGTGNGGEGVQRRGRAGPDERAGLFKFSNDGRQLLQTIGTPGVFGDHGTRVNRPTFLTQEGAVHVAEVDNGRVRNYRRQAGANADPLVGAPVYAAWKYRVNTPRVPRRLLPLLILLLATCTVGAQLDTEYQRLGRDILKELIETDTTPFTGSTTIAAERMAARLVAAGIPKADVHVVRGTHKGADRKGNLVMRYRAKDTRRPVLFIAHLDVVEARREDWSMDPFVLAPTRLPP